MEEVMSSEEKTIVLVNDSESLVTRIFKGKYYHDVEFLQAKLGSNPSYVRRSSFQYQQLVKN